jgi:endothelin-converting enzyme/putative endopeptidase
MNINWTPIKTAIVLAWCGAALVTTGAMASGQTAPAAKEEENAAGKTAATAQATLRPGDDFFAWANKDWLAKTAIPEDRSRWGAMDNLAEDTNQRIVKLIEGVGDDKKAAPETRKVADYFNAYMDEAAIEARGTAPLMPALAQIAAIKDKAGLVRALGASVRADVDPLNNTHFAT